jgi:hypothetical protein
MGIFERFESLENPRETLSAASVWIGALGAALSVIGLIATFVAMGSSNEAGRFGYALRVLIAIGFWLVPGLVYLACAWGIRNRKRWSASTAEVNTFVQMFFAGAMVVLSLLSIKAMWPFMILGLVWVVPLLIVPRITAPCNKAMDMIAQLPELGIESSTRDRRA